MIYDTSHKSHPVHNFLRADLALAHVLQAVRNRTEPAFPQLHRERLDGSILDEARHLLKELDHVRAVLVGHGVLFRRPREPTPERRVDKGLCRERETSARAHNWRQPLPEARTIEFDVLPVGRAGYAAKKEDDFAS